jgi:hypothetical protein
MTRSQRSTVPSQIVALAFPLLLLGGAMNEATARQVDDRWPIHAIDRPQPPVVTPGPAVSVAPPSDAIVLFDGRDLSRWRAGDGSEARWRVENGYVEVVASTGSLVTADAFGDAQLHIEWAAPATPSGEGQGRGNSGVFFMGGRYEVQILDSFENPTYPDGQAGALYGQIPPLVNASRPPGEWQSYDIIFRAPRFAADGTVTSPARVTVLHNGVLIQDNVELVGPTAHNARPPYEAHEDRLPISLQDHGDPVRFRNIWIRELR